MSLVRGAIMQAFSDPSLNFIFILAVVTIITICCYKFGRKKDSNSDIIGPSNTAKYLQYAGLLCLILAMTIYYSSGYYGFAIFMPLAILAIILIMVSACMGKGSSGAN